LNVRAGICEVIQTVVPLVGKDISVSKLYPYLLELVEDKETDVRISCIKSFVKFVEVLGAELMNSLIPHVKNLMEDKKWRVREATYQTLIDLALSYQSLDVFQKHIEPIFFGFLKDKANTIRELGTSKLIALVQVYKTEWLLNSCLPKLNDALKKDNGYLYRITALNCLRAIAQVCPPDTLNEKILPIFLKNAKDEVPNVRFVVVKIIKSLLVKFDSNTFASQIKPCLQELTQDSDKDVSYFAQEALSGL